MFFLLYRCLDQAGWHFGLASVAQRMSSCHNISLMLSFHFSLQFFSYKYIISYVLYYISIILCITIISYLYTSSTDSSTQTICLLSEQQYLVGTTTPRFARRASSSYQLLESTTIKWIRRLLSFQYYRLSDYYNYLLLLFIIKLFIISITILIIIIISTT